MSISAASRTLSSTSSTSWTQLLDPELRRRERARRRLLAFTQYTYPSYQASWHHALLAETLDRFASGLTPRLVCCIPPQHGKSELFSRRLPALLLGRDPDTRIIATAYGASLASDFNRDVQRILDDDAYRRLFPGTRLSGRNVRHVAGPLPLRNSEVFEILGRRGFYRSAGVGGPITGQPMDVGLIDDPLKNREEADSPTIRQSIWRWYTGAFLSRAHKDTRIAIVMTRWNLEDLVGLALKIAEEDPAADQWECLILPAVAEEVRCQGDPRQPGEALWPAKVPLSELLKRKAASITDWHSLYQQRPRAEGSVEWPDEHFNWPGFWFDEWPSNLNLKVMALDPSKGRESRAGDYQALILWGRTPDGTEWVEADLGKRPMTAARAPDGTALTEGMVEHAVERYIEFAPEGIGLETNTFQQLLVIPFRQEAARRGTEIRIYEIDNTINKNVRIRRLGEPLGQRKMRFRRTAGTRLLVEQLKQFAVADHDDGPDGLEMVRRTAIAIWNGRPRKR